MPFCVGSVMEGKQLAWSFAECLKIVFVPPYSQHTVPLPRLSRNRNEGRCFEANGSIGCVL